MNTFFRFALCFGCIIFSSYVMAACDIYISSVPFTVDQNDKTYCVHNNTGTIEFDPENAILLDVEAYAGSDHEGNPLRPRIRPAINIEAIRARIKFISRIKNINPTRVDNEIDVGIFAKRRGADIILNNVQLNNFSIGIHIGIVDSVYISDARISDIRHSGIDIFGVKNDITLIRPWLEKFRTDSSYPFSSLRGIDANVGDNANIYITGAKIQKFYNKSHFERPFNNAMAVSAGEYSTIDIKAPSISYMTDRYRPHVKSSAISAHCDDNCSIIVRDGKFNESVQQAASGYHAIGISSQEPHVQFEVLRNRFSQWNKVLWTREKEYTDIEGFYADNEVFLYKENGGYPSDQQIFNVNEDIVDGGGNVIHKW